MKKDDIVKIIDNLKTAYSDAKCSLDFNSPFELAIAVMLSAQCTDERVNKVVPSIFAKYSTPKDFVDIDIGTLENLVHSCGFYKNKSKNIKEMSKKLIEVYNGEIPKNMKDLMSLAGIGRKSANVIMLEAFNLPQGIAVDTHCKRLSNRLGLSNKSDPEKIELDLLKIIPKKYYKDVNHLFIYHGRNTCTAQNPKCDNCCIKEFCNFYKKSKSKIK